MMAVEERTLFSAATRGYLRALPATPRLHRAIWRRQEWQEQHASRPRGSRRSDRQARRAWARVARTAEPRETWAAPQPKDRQARGFPPPTRTYSPLRRLLLSQGLQV